MNFKKGDKVLVKAIVMTKEIPYDKFTVIRFVERPKNAPLTIEARHLKRVAFEPWKEGIVAGWSTRLSGLVVPGYMTPDNHFGGEERTAGYMKDMKTHKVIMVLPLRTEQWQKPWACLEGNRERI